MLSHIDFEVDVATMLKILDQISTFEFSSYVLYIHCGAGNQRKKNK